MWESTPMEVRDAFTYLDSLCFNAYMNAPATKMSSWTKASDILSKRYTFVPIGAL
ncbi:hypothetical protein Taro_019478, partial [Colocasia esculenta]|nr:hypothetical protein [Colocasia esculenta]